MTNNKILLGMLVLALVFGNFITGCVSVGEKNIGANLTAKEGESEIIIDGIAGRSPMLSEDITITIDGQQKGVIKGDGSAKIIVPNGDHILSVKVQINGLMPVLPLFSDPFSFSANSESITYRLMYPATTFQKVEFILISKTKL